MRALMHSNQLNRRRIKKRQGRYFLIVHQPLIYVVFDLVQLSGQRNKIQAKIGWSVDKEPFRKHPGKFILVSYILFIALLKL